MSRPKSFLKKLHVNLHALHWAFINYYADKYDITDRSDVIRRMVTAFASADRRFDPDAFQKFAQKLAKSEEDDALREAILRESRLHAAERKAADAPTATMKTRRK